MDKQRALIVGSLAGTAAAGAAAVLITDSIVFSWVTGFVWYAVRGCDLIALRPATLPGETIAASLYALALIALFCCGIAAAGIGASAGFGMRRAFAAARNLVRSGSPSRLALGGSMILLPGASLFGVARLPAILTYGPWSCVVVAAKPDRQGQQLTFDYWSRAFGTYRSAVMFLPPEYAASLDLAFPLLYLLHGSPGSDMD